jgi:hypothetical protein
MMTAIVWAAHKGHAEIACDLINAGSQHVQRALLIATTRCHVTVVEAMCRLLALKPASQRPDMSCAILIAAAHGSASAISALSSICPVPQIIADLRCSCIKGSFTVFSQSESALTENSKQLLTQPAFSLIEGDSKSTQCFRWLLPGAFKALLQNQF